MAASYATKRFVVSAQAGHEQTDDPAGDSNSNSFAGATVGAEIPIGTRMAFVAGAGFDLRRYDQADALFLTERKDERVDAQIGFKVLLADNVYVRPRVTYTRNFSNIAIYDYERVTASIGLRFEF